MRTNRRFSGISLLASLVAGVLLLTALGSTANAQRRVDDSDVFKGQRQVRQPVGPTEPGTQITATGQKGIGTSRALPGSNAPGIVRSDVVTPMTLLASPVSNCTLNPGPQPGSGFICNIYETDAAGNPSQIGNVINLPNPVIGGLLVLKKDPAIPDNDVTNWTNVLKFGDGTNSTTSIMQLFSKGCNTGNPNATTCFPPYNPGVSAFITQANPGPTIFPSSPNTYNIFSGDDNASARSWTLAGSTGQHDEDSAGIVRYNSFGVNIANGQTGSLHMRYNLTAVEGLARLCPATLSTIRTRFRNSDNGGNTARLTYEIHTSSIAAGGNTILYTFDSNGRGGGQAFKTATELAPIDFNFNTNMYWIEATIFRSVAAEFSDLGSIQIWESDGTPCP